MVRVTISKTKTSKSQKHAGAGRYDYLIKKNGRIVASTTTKVKANKIARRIRKLNK